MILRFRNLRDLVRYRRRFDFEATRASPEVYDTPWRIKNYYDYIATLRNARSSSRRLRSSARAPPSDGTRTV